ncbi:MAG: hypothetical protein IBJ18_00090 [Phycisphaerales bacterium]|nr:hypothetical protein [Phycisphaerales bacterium]
MGGAREHGSGTGEGKDGGEIESEVEDEFAGEFAGEVEREGVAEVDKAGGRCVNVASGLFLPGVCAYTLDQAFGDESEGDNPGD